MTAACLDCSSHDVHWFTPPGKAADGAVFLCHRWGHLNIISRRESRGLAGAAKLTARAA
jgi:hypothetical protein